MVTFRPAVLIWTYVCLVSSFTSAFPYSQCLFTGEMANQAGCFASSRRPERKQWEMSLPNPKLPLFQFPNKEQFRKGFTGLALSTLVLSSTLPPGTDVPYFLGAAPVAAIPKTIAALKAEERTVVDLFKEAVPSVVYINTFIQTRDVFSMDVMSVPQGAGSGVMWTKDGVVVTNFHVIRQAQGATVTVTDKSGKGTTQYPARVIGVDPDKDIAVLKIDPKAPAPPTGAQGGFTPAVVPLPGADKSLVTRADDAIPSFVPIKLGNSGDLEVGQSTFAIGNPFGLDHSLTTGIVSGLGREMRSPTGRPITGCIQTDAAINPGNSGGALLDSDGSLVGMNTAIYSPSGASAGIGFAIPVDSVKPIVESLLANGRVARASVGISYLESAQARALGVARGVLVLDAPEGGPARAAGVRGTTRSAAGYIELGDVVVGIDDDAVESEADLFKALDKHRPGEEVLLRVRRVDRATGDFELVELRVTLKDRSFQLSSGIATRRDRGVQPSSAYGGGGGAAPWEAAPWEGWGEEPPAYQR